MLTGKDRHIAALRKKKWKMLGADSEHLGVGFYRQSRSLSCGCNMCQWMAEEKRLKRKRRRARLKMEAKHEFIKER